jgi:hypothetical protein
MKVKNEPEDERDLLALTQVLGSKKRAREVMKITQGQPFSAKQEVARELAKELKAKKRLRMIESQPPQEVSRENQELLFILRNLALMGMPHKPTTERKITRMIRRGPSQWISISLTARSHDEGVGIPFGINARRILTMICTIAVKTKSPVITLETAAEFMKKMGWKADASGKIGGNKYERMAEALEQIQKCSIDVEVHGILGAYRRQAESLSIIRRYDLPSRTDEKLLDQGGEPLLDLDPGISKQFKVQIDPLFFRELVGDPESGYRGSAFPLPERFVAEFSKSTELDCAQFLAARCSAAQSTSRINLHDIHEQLAFHPSNFSKFKKEFITALERVKQLWEGCNAQVEGHKLIIGPVLDGKYLVDPTRFEALPEDLFGLGTPTLPPAASDE